MLTIDLNEAMGSREISPKPAALILFNPVTNLDIPQIQQQATAEKLERLMHISPHQQLSAALPPTIIFHGTADTIVPAASVTAFVEKARSLGSKNIVYYSYNGRGHEFYYGPGNRKDYQDTLVKTVSFLESLGWLQK